MKKFAFISRHVPGQEQVDMAHLQGIEIEFVGDRDAFTVNSKEFIELGFVGVVVVHPAAAMRLCRDLEVAIFENGNRAEVGKPPQFYPIALLVFPSPYKAGYAYARQYVADVLDDSQHV